MDLSFFLCIDIPHLYVLGNLIAYISLIHYTIIIVLNSLSLNNVISISINTSKHSSLIGIFLVLMLIAFEYIQKKRRVYLVWSNRAMLGWGIYLYVNLDSCAIYYSGYCWYKSLFFVLPHVSLSVLTLFEGSIRSFLIWQNVNVNNEAVFFLLILHQANWAVRFCKITTINAILSSSSTSLFTASIENVSI